MQEKVQKEREGDKEKEKEQEKEKEKEKEKEGWGGHTYVLIWQNSGDIADWVKLVVLLLQQIQSLLSDGSNQTE